MPKINGASKDIKTNIQEPSNDWIFCIKEDILELSEDKDCEVNNMLDIETLPHPGTREPSVFLFSSNNTIQEILTYSEPKRSWFIDESVKSDGKMRLSTPVDPLFLVLPYLKKYCNDRAVPLDQLLQDEEYPATSRLLTCNGLKYLSTVADKKGNGDIVAFKYNEEKTLTWLKKKTTRVAEVLKQKNILLETSADECNYLRFAAGIVADYLSDDLKEKFISFLNIPGEPQSFLKRKSDVKQQDSRDFKKMKPSVEVKKSTPKVVKASTPTTKKKKPTSKASGTKSIASYFKS